MLLEKTSYPDDFPIHISITEISEYPLHYHQDIEIVYVLKGKLRLKNGYCDYILKEGDIFTNNGHEVHCLYAEQEENAVATIKISNLFFTQYFPALYKSCYRTYSPKESGAKTDILRKTILQILLLYLQKSFDYEQKCITATLELIEFLNSSFNLFSFEKQIVVNFENDDPVVIQRMSRIINYLYQNHASKITLEDLAAQEHLSTFYISHLIRENVGMSFRDFLCFARAEWSEIYLLDTNKSICAISKDVGFSTTSYYEKHFYKWFGRTPEEHRRLFYPMVKSQTRPALVAVLPLNKAIGIVKAGLSAANSQDNHQNPIHYLKLDLHVDAFVKAILPFDYNLELIITPEDFQVMGTALFEQIKQLGCNKVMIRSDRSTQNPEDLIPLHNLLERQGVKAILSSATVLEDTSAYGLDSILAPMHLLNAHSVGKPQQLQARLRDQGESSIVLKGLPSLMTSSMVPKPVYYAYFALQKMKGDLICWGKNYLVSRLDSQNPTFVILAYNYSSQLEKYCSMNLTPYEIDHIIQNFKDELELNVSMSLPCDTYCISKYSLNRRNNVFHFMAKLDFPKKLNLAHNAHMGIFCLPEMEVFTERVETSINLDFSLKGLEMQMVLIQPIHQEE